MAISVVRVLAVFLALATQTDPANLKYKHNQIEFRILHSQTTYYIERL